MSTEPLRAFRNPEGVPVSSGDFEAAVKEWLDQAFSGDEYDARQYREIIAHFQDGKETAESRLVEGHRGYVALIGLYFVQNERLVADSVMELIPDIIKDAATAFDLKGDGSFPDSLTDLADVRFSALAKESWIERERVNSAQPKVERSTVGREVEYQRALKADSYSEVTEAQSRIITLRAQVGDETAFERLVRWNHPRMRKLGQSYYLPDGGQSDLHQAALLGLLNGVRDYDPEFPGSARGFLELCMSRQVITEVKTSMRVKHEVLTRAVSLDTPINGWETAPDTAGGINLGEIIPGNRSTDPAEIAIHREQLANLIRAVLSRLTEIELTVFQGIYSGFTYEEISAAHGFTTKMVDNAVQRFKRKLGEANTLFGDG